MSKQNGHRRMVKIVVEPPEELLEDPFFKFALEKYQQLAQELRVFHPIEGMLIWEHLLQFIAAELLEVTTKGREVAREALQEKASGYGTKVGTTRT